MLTQQIYDTDHFVILGERSKVPVAGSNWTKQKATRDEAISAVSEGKNIARVVGDNLITLDFDNGAYSELLDMEEKLGSKLVELTTVVKTGRGWHAYFEKPDGNFPSRITPNLEIRTGNKYNVLPPSVHENGIEYSFCGLWENDAYHETDKIGLMPPELVEIIGKIEPVESLPKGFHPKLGEVTSALNVIPRNSFAHANGKFFTLMNSVYHNTGGQGYQAWRDWCVSHPDYRDDTGLLKMWQDREKIPKRQMKDGYERYIWKCLKIVRQGGWK